MAEALLTQSTFSTLSRENAVESESTPQKTVLRLKRRIEDSPSQVLVLSYKRLKQDVELESLGFGGENEADGNREEEIHRRVFRLAGTVTAVEKSDSSMAETIINALLDVNEAKKRLPDTKEAIKNRVIRRLKSHNLKAKKDARTNSSESRFRVVCSKRGHSPSVEINNDENSPPFDTDGDESTGPMAKESERLFNLLDLVADSEFPQTKRAKSGSDPRKLGSVTCNGVPMVREKTALESKPVCSSSNGESINIDTANPETIAEFVFDLYVSNEGAVEEQMHNQFVSVERADEDYELDCYREAESDEECRMEDDEDSNEEGNYKNDYPDTDNESEEDTSGFRRYYSGDQDLSHCFGKVQLHSNGDELSSEDDADAIYSMEDDGVDNGLGGGHSQYQRYKARLRREQEMADEVVSSPSDSD